LLAPELAPQVRSVGHNVDLYVWSIGDAQELVAIKGIALPSSLAGELPLTRSHFRVLRLLAAGSAWPQVHELKLWEAPVDRVLTIQKLDRCPCFCSSGNTSTVLNCSDALQSLLCGVSRGGISRPIDP
jgi:hypothetical protein